MINDVKTAKRWRYASAILSTFWAGSFIAIMVILIIVSDGAKPIVAFSLFGSFTILFYILSSIYYFLPKLKTGKMVMSRITRCFYILVMFGIYLPVFFIAIEGPLGWVLFGILVFLSVIGIIFYAIKPKPWYTWLETTYYMVFIWFWLIALPHMFIIFGENAIILYTIATLLITISMVFFRISTHVKRSQAMIYRFTFNIIFIFAQICHIVFMFLYLT